MIQSLAKLASPWSEFFTWSDQGPPRVMLTDNLWVENGLVNGSMGTVRGVVWNEGQDPIKDIRTAIMVEVDDYDGPKFPGTALYHSRDDQPERHYSKCPPRTS